MGLNERKIQVEIWSDVVCPFCYIGKRNFEKALAASGLADQVNVVFKSFELDPAAEKSQTISIEEVLSKKYGRPVEWARKANENVKQSGAAAGLEINTDKIIPTNSFDAHRLIHFAKSKGLQAQMVDRLFKAYFTEGKDIALHDVLRSLAKEVGLVATEVDSLLQSRESEVAVRTDESLARQMGIQGVPMFVFNESEGVSGAQPVAVFAEVLKGLAAKS